MQYKIIVQISMIFRRDEFGNDQQLNDIRASIIRDVQMLLLLTEFLNDLLLFGVFVVHS